MTVEYIYMERSEIEETGEFDLEGLFIRLGYAVEQIGANVLFWILLKQYFRVYRMNSF